MVDQITSSYSKTLKILNDDYSDIPITKIASSDLEGYTQQDRGSKTLIVHLTSRNILACPFCIKNNKFIRAATREYSEHLDVTEIYYNHLSEVKHDQVLHNYLKSKNISVSGLPVTLVLNKDGKLGKRQGVWPTIMKDFKAYLKR